MKKVLAIIPRRLGDAIFTIPSIHYLKQKKSECEIDLLCGSSPSLSVFENNPNINRRFLPNDFDLNNHYDVVINFDDEKWSEDIFGKMAGEKWNPKNCLNLLQAERYLKYFTDKFQDDLVENDYPTYQLFPSQSDREAIFEKIRAVHKNRLVGFHMGCHGLSKKRSRFFNRFSHKRAWPLKYFIKLAKALKQIDPSIKIVLTGSKEEKKMTEVFCKKIPDTINLSGRTSILELRALMDYCDLFISNDTGVLHIACSAALPVVALFGVSGSSCEITGPYPRNGNYTIFLKKDIDQISPKKVLEKVKQLLGLKNDEN